MSPWPQGISDLASLPLWAVGVMQKAQLPVMSLLLNALALWCCWSLPDLPGGRGKSSRVLVNLLVLVCVWALLLIQVSTNVCKYILQTWILWPLFGTSILTKTNLEKVIQCLLWYMRPGANLVHLMSLLEGSWSIALGIPSPLIN